MTKISQAKKEARANFPGFWQRLVEALGTAKKRQIANLLSISDASVWQWEHENQIPSLTNLLKIAKLGNTSIEYLLTGRGQKLTGPKKKTLPSESDSSYTEETFSVYLGDAEKGFINELAGASGRTPEEQIREMVIDRLIQLGLVRDQAEDGVELVFFGEYAPKLIQMKLLGEIAAGKPIEVYPDQEWIRVPDSFAVQGRENFVLKVRGDSMQDEDIHDGDLIICIEAVEANNGDTVVALIDGEQATVKKFYREGKKVRLEPANKSFAPIIVGAEKVKIQGIVVGIYRRP